MAAVALLGAGAWWWLRDGDGGSDRASSGDSAAQQGAARLSARGARGLPRWLGQAGLESRRVAGRVTYAGAGVAGATVRLELPRELRPVVPPVVVTTGPDGTFDFGAQMATEFLVMASAPGRAPDGAKVDMRDPTRSPRPDRLELMLADCAQTVVGMVHDHGGPIAGASVRVATHDESIAIATTGEDGRYQLCVGPGGGGTPNRPR